MLRAGYLPPTALQPTSVAQDRPNQLDFRMRLRHELLDQADIVPCKQEHTHALNNHWLRITISKVLTRDAVASCAATGREILPRVPRLPSASVCWPVLLALPCVATSRRYPYM